MKKSIIALFASALVASGVSAQTSTDKSGGIFALGDGVTNTEKVVTGAVVVAVAAAVINNNRSNSSGGPGPDTPTCEGDDPLVDGVCVGTTNTVTVTTSGTGTNAITVPVTFTYAPTVQ